MRLRTEHEHSLCSCLETSLDAGCFPRILSRQVRRNGVQREDPDHEDLVVARRGNGLVPPVATTTLEYRRSQCPTAHVCRMRSENEDDVRRPHWRAVLSIRIEIDGCLLDDGVSLPACERLTTKGRSMNP